METLKNINSKNKDTIYNDNFIYLTDLTKSLYEIIELLKKIKIKNTVLYQTINYLGIKNDFNNILINNYSETLTFCEKTILDIKLLKTNIPQYTNLSKINLKTICDEYFVFHNSIIEKIKQFLNYYTNYKLNIYSLYKQINKHLEPVYSEYNCLIYNYNNNSVCRNDPNFQLKKNAFDQKNNELTKYNNYLVEEINTFDNIKSKTKEINTQFLHKIKKISY